ncbi:MAG: PaaX family transcriptional regulator C-terminal domain-containing protein [Ilumatobacter sp.]
MRIDTSDLGVDALDARSLVLSALLGTHPPALPVRALVALGELFGIRSGTIRTALSRMVAAGDLNADDGWYRLTGRLLERQRQQDSGRRISRDTWDGTWWNVTVEPDRRDTSERRAFRSTLEGARFGELRPDIWLRPATEPELPRFAGAIVMRGDLGVDDVHGLVARLWPLDDLEARASKLLAALREQRELLDKARDDDLPTAFAVAAATVRFLRVEPQLPDELQPADWTASTLRAVHDDFALVFEQRLRAFFAR